MLLTLLLVILLESNVPSDRGNSGHCSELVDDVTRQEVDVVVVEMDADVADAVTTQLIQLGVLHPLDTLTDRWLVQVQLQLEKKK